MQSKRGKNQRVTVRRSLMGTHRHNTETDIFRGLTKNDINHAAALAKHTVYRKEEEEELQINQGRMYVRLMLDASNATGLTLDKIQFNFCLKGLSSKKEQIEKAIEMYLNHGFNEENYTKEDKSKINKVGRPFKISSTPDATSLHDYKDTLSFRGESFCKAAESIVKHSGLDSEKEKKILDVIDVLFKAYQKNIEDNPIKEKQQAYYNAILNALKDILQETIYTTLDDKKILSYLKNAETINNMREKKCHITLSGDLTEKIELNGVISLQIDEPLTQFKYLSKEQQNEWINAIKAYKENPEDTNIPEWFKRMPTFEKKIWIDRLNLNKSNQADMDAYISPVVKKGGIPGLRNLYFSTFANFTYQNNTISKKSISNDTVRSSNLIVQEKEGSSKLSGSEKRLTGMNLHQVNHIFDMKYPIQKKEPFELLWDVQKNRQQHVLYQTLLRLRGGGDDYVIGHKSEAIKNHSGKHQPLAMRKIEMHESNHCIGAPNKLMHGIMHLAGANTQTLNHVINPVKDFITIAVLPTFVKEFRMNHLSDNVIREMVNKVFNPLFEEAKEGRLTLKMFNEKLAESPNFKHFTDNNVKRAEQIDQIKRVFLSLNTYVQINNKSSSYKKNYQVHMAALEELIYQDTGNRIQSSCKSGKDREGIEKTYRNAMIDFWDKYGSLPPPKEDGTMDRKNFINIFIELFITNHQARLAELNANGCEGLKALANIIPKDILVELRKDERIKLLELHKNNSALNTFGQSNVSADHKTYQLATEFYSSIINSVVNPKLKDNQDTSIVNVHH